MPAPVKRVWYGHFVHGSVDYQRRTADQPACLYFFVELDEPIGERGRIVQVQLMHEYVVAAIINELVHQMRVKGHRLPDTMGNP